MVGSCNIVTQQLLVFMQLKMLLPVKVVQWQIILIFQKFDLLRTHGITREKIFFKKNFKILPTHYEQILLDTISDLPIFRLL